MTLAVVAALIGLPLLFGGHNGSGDKASNQQKTRKTAPAPAAVVAAPAAKTADNCAGNTAAKLLLVSISQRHMGLRAGQDRL